MARRTSPRLTTSSLATVGVCKRERALDADAVAQLAHGVGLVQAATLAGDHVALEHLDTFLATLDDADVHLDLVARRERREVVTQ